MFCLHVKKPLPPGNNPIAVNKYIIIIIIFIDSLKLRGTLTLRNRVVRHSNGDYCRNAESKQAACCVSCNGPRQNTCTARFLLLPWLAFLSIILARTHCSRQTHT